MNQRSILIVVSFLNVMSIGKCFKLRETLPRGPVTVITRELTSTLTPSGMSTVPVLTMVFIAGQPASEGAGSGPVSHPRPGMDEAGHGRPWATSRLKERYLGPWFCTARYGSAANDWQAE